MSNKTVVFSFFSNNNFATALHEALHYSLGDIEIHQFPDEEILVKINSDVKNARVIFIATLDRPNTKILPLVFAAQTAKTLGAASITLLAPYLPYMRQDKAFAEGEGVTAIFFAKLISTYFDALITVDPHLHRFHELNSLYSIPAQVLHAEPCVSNWIKDHIKNPILIGPDSESSQWVARIAQAINAPFLVLEKKRLSDHQVKISTLNVSGDRIDIQDFQDKTPILFDDIISTGKTLMTTIDELKKLNMPNPICIGVHAIFAGNAYQHLLNSGAAQIITCNTILHETNQIDISKLIVQALISVK